MDFEWSLLFSSLVNTAVILNPRRLLLFERDSTASHWIRTFFCKAPEKNLLELILEYRKYKNWLREFPFLNIKTGSRNSTHSFRNWWMEFRKVCSYISYTLEAQWGSSFSKWFFSAVQNLVLPKMCVVTRKKMCNSSHIFFSQGLVTESLESTLIWNK